MPGAVFLDRDGVLCENQADYVKTWRDFRWIPGALEAMRTLGRLDCRIVIVTNQSAINRGLTTLENVRDIHGRMLAAIQQAGGRVDAIYLCPHRPEEGCRCRKPGLLLFRTAAQELGFDPGQSYLIGDNLSDLQAGWDLGARVILVRTGLGMQTAARLRASGRQVLTLPDVGEAARWLYRTRRNDAGTDHLSPEAAGTAAERV